MDTLPLEIDRGEKTLTGTPIIYHLCFDSFRTNKEGKGYQLYYKTLDPLYILPWGVNPRLYDVVGDSWEEVIGKMKKYVEEGLLPYNVC